MRRYRVQYGTLIPQGNKRGVCSRGRMFRSRSPEQLKTKKTGSWYPCSSNSKGLAAGDVEVDNSNTVLEKLSTLYAEHLMSDVTLVVSGVEYPAHRLILCASSEVFQVMLMKREWSESQERRVRLQESPACAAVFASFMRYFYTGQIRINHSVVMPILALADKYNVKDLVGLCTSYMCTHTALAATNNHLVSWLQYALNVGHYRVAQICQNFVKWNIELVARYSDFGSFEPEILQLLLQQNDIVAHDEMAVYNCVVRWLDLQEQRLAGEESKDAHMEQLVVALMSHVRFPMMSPRQLAELLLSPLTKKHKEFFMERMAIGMAFHSGQQDRVHEVLKMEDGRMLFTPRLYTADTWSTPLCVDNFHALPPYHARTLVFSSRASTAEHAGSRTSEWVVDLYPKGVWFKKCYLIVWQGTVEVPERVLRTIRVSVTCRDTCPTRVLVGVLVRGQQDGIEHVTSVSQRYHRFLDEERVLNFDNLLPFDSLNPGAAAHVGTPCPATKVTSTSSAPNAASASAAANAASTSSGSNAASTSSAANASSSRSAANASSSRSAANAGSSRSAPNASSSRSTANASSSRSGANSAPTGSAASAASTSGAKRVPPAHGVTYFYPCNQRMATSPYLIGPDRDNFKVHISIAPLSDVSCLTPPPFPGGRGFASWASDS
ncbi:BTB/POZ domain-containing protein 17 isoform X1 [Schistocerca americana]|uniref:BTB/POZ domain-containing protein 17 isoform X1 n=1 Tax=Schistocerca americana TaxID=7009 RepID=UPI001F4F87F8|nr:BTB/POZ domain-containing protein 17 isoform X1 [Schistocerca americana]